MDEQDYGAAFGLSETGEEVTEVAEPSDDAIEAQGEEEQETAEPAVEEAGGKTEDDARFAAARRKAEAERDAAVREAQAQAQRTIDEAFKNSGLINPYTKAPITSKAEYDAYRQRFGAERKARVLEKSGTSEEEFSQLVQELPEVQQVKQQLQDAEQALQTMRGEQAQRRIEEQISELSKLDPTIHSVEDLLQMPNYERFYELVQRGNDYVDAWKLANLDKLTQAAAEAAQQKAINAARGKNHLNVTAERGSGGVSVPEDVRSAYLLFNPNASETEIQKHYSAYVRNN